MEVTSNTISQLQKLFELSPPDELRQSLTNVFFNSLESLHVDAIPKEFKQDCENVRFILQFLNEAEKEKAGFPA